MCASHLEDCAECCRLFLQFGSKTVERCEEHRALCREADLDARREGVVRRLCHICVVVRRDDVVAPLRLAAQLERTVAEHFVHVHIDGRARAALDRVDGELVDETARDDLICGTHEDVADFVWKSPCVHVRECRRLFHLCECDDEVRVELLPRDVEVLDGAHRLHAVVDIIGDFQFAEKVVFLSHGALSFAF